MMSESTEHIFCDCELHRTKHLKQEYNLVLVYFYTFIVLNQVLFILGTTKEANLIRYEHCILLKINLNYDGDFEAGFLKYIIIIFNTLSWPKIVHNNSRKTFVLVISRRLNTN